MPRPHHPSWPRFLLLFMGMVCAAACGRPSDRSTQHEDRDSTRTLVKIGQEDFSAAQFEVFLLERFPESTSPLPRNDSVLSELLDRAIDERLLLHAARQHQMTIPDRDVQEYLSNGSLVQGSSPGKTANPPDSQRFERARDVLMVNRYVQSIASARYIPSLDEETKYYNAQLGLFQEPERYHVAEILVRDEPLARAIEGMLAKKKSFESLARKYSRNELAATGGDLGWFARGELPEQFEKAVMGLKPQQHSGVIKTDYGFHIFKLKGIQPGHAVPLAEARRQIQTLLLNEHRKEAVAQEIAQLRKSIQIEIRVQNLGFKYNPPRTGG